MRAYRITDFMIPATILQNKVIADQIYEDGEVFDISTVDILREYWIGIELNGNTIACYRVHPMGRILWQLHARVLPEYREKFSIKATTMAFKWAAKNIPDLNKIVCFIPDAHPNVAAHAIQIGLTLEGSLEASYLKNNKIIRQDIYSITKEKINKL